MCGWAVYMPYSAEPCQLLLEILEVLGGMSVSFQVDFKTVGFFSRNRFCRARSAAAIFSRKARKESFAVVVFFASLPSLTLRFYRWVLTKAIIRAVLQSTFQEKRLLSPVRRCLSFERYLKHLFGFSDLTDVGAFTTKLPTTNQWELCTSNIRSSFCIAVNIFVVLSRLSANPACTTYAINYGPTIIVTWPDICIFFKEREIMYSHSFMPKHLSRSCALFELLS